MMPSAETLSLSRNPFRVALKGIGAKRIDETLISTHGLFVAILDTSYCNWT